MGNLLRIVLINIEFNAYNGLVISLLHIDMVKPNIDAALIGINASERFLYIDLFFNTIKIFDKT